MTELASAQDIRLVHRFMSDEKLHAYTSPDVKGLFATSETIEGARQEALAILELIFTRRGYPLPRMTSLEAQATGEAARSGAFGSLTSSDTWRNSGSSGPPRRARRCSTSAARRAPRSASPTSSGNCPRVSSTPPSTRRAFPHPT